MKRAGLMLMTLLMWGCEYEGGEGGEYEGGEGGGSWGGGGGGGGGTSGSGGSCNDANESCSSGNCSGEGGTMLPGANCLNCHTGGEQGRFTAAGTVFSNLDGSSRVSGATVILTDSAGQSITLTSNSVGNFYTTRSLNFPITAEIEANGFTSAMSQEVSTGACNSCHACDGAAGGKLYTE